MNDRFKYRVYYKPHNKVYNVICLNCDRQKEIIIEYNGSTALVEWENCEIMQSTGLYDKNGKLIYEGDIVFNNCGRWIIKYCDVCKSFQCFDNTYGCYACAGDYQWCDFIEDLNKTTIEGNIYEHEEHEYE